jgi:flagellar basal-body rod protein FlgB
MSSAKTDIFDLAEKKLSWLAERQNVLASNIANANTPGFRGSDIQSFASVLTGMTAVVPTRTQAMHLSGTLPADIAETTPDSSPAKSVDGNSIALDEQLTKVADTESSQSLVTTIWKSYVGMFNTVLGKGS